MNAVNESCYWDRVAVDKTMSLRYIKIRGWATALNAIAPLCITYCALIAILQPAWRAPYHLGYWAFTEAAFYFLTYLYRTIYLQRPAWHPELPSAEERRKLFDQCLDSTQDHAAYISRWFLGADVQDIKRENIKEFFRWAFLSLHYHDPSYDEEVEQYLVDFEDRSGLRFEAGRSDVKSLRLTSDPVRALHRSLTWYSVGIHPILNISANM